jgi:exodeoxyribonuclease VII large subunit
LEDKALTDLSSDMGHDGGKATPNLPEYSVSEVSGAIKKTLEESFGYVRVRGEISGFKRHSSGHLYLTLKDDRAALAAVLWRGNATRLRFAPEDGLEVICTGRVTTYPGRSTYQLIIESMEPAGAGALMALLEERRKKLAAEGLFDAARKRAIPFLPRVIGVVTSPTGAVIRDIMHRLNERFPRHVLVWPVLVQGEGAAEQVARAVEGFNRLGEGSVPRPDVIIVARGGGSIEDLWAFNEEIVVRAVAASTIPVISAVGHETDTTLIDHASDKRCPTPTAAAEAAVPVRADLVSAVMDRERRLFSSVTRLLDHRRQLAAGLARGLPRLRDLLGLPQQRFDELADRLPRALLAGLAAHERRLISVSTGLRPRLLTDGIARRRQAAGDFGRRLPRALAMSGARHRQRLLEVSAGLRPRLIAEPITRHNRHLADLSSRLGRCGEAHLKEARRRFEAVDRLFSSLDYRRVLERGFALVRDGEGQPMTSAKAVAAGSRLSIEFRDGTVAATADQKTAPTRKPRPAVAGQGDLF